jgi:hypothetical protein
MRGIRKEGLFLGLFTLEPGLHIVQEMMHERVSSDTLD